MRQNFIRCGLTGLFIEIFFTGMDSFKHHDFRMMGHSSVIMFPIYGSAAILNPVSKALKGKSFLTRGIIYTLGIYAVEFCSGKWLRRHNICPWDYSCEPTNIDGLIRLDFAPFWFVAGLLLEQIACLPEQTFAGRSQRPPAL